MYTGYTLQSEEEGARCTLVIWSPVEHHNRARSTRGQPLPFQNALPRVYMFSMTLGRVLIQVKNDADPNRAPHEPIFAICPYP